MKWASAWHDTEGLLGTSAWATGRRWSEHQSAEHYPRSCWGSSDQRCGISTWRSPVRILSPTVNFPTWRLTVGHDPLPYSGVYCHFINKRSKQMKMMQTGTLGSHRNCIWSIVMPFYDQLFMCLTSACFWSTLCRLQQQQIESRTSLCQRNNPEQHEVRPQLKGTRRLASDRQDFTESTFSNS